MLIYTSSYYRHAASLPIISLLYAAITLDLRRHYAVTYALMFYCCRLFRALLLICCYASVRVAERDGTFSCARYDFSLLRHCCATDTLPPCRYITRYAIVDVAGVERRAMPALVQRHRYAR